MVITVDKCKINSKQRRDIYRKIFLSMTCHKGRSINHSLVEVAVPLSSSTFDVFQQRNFKGHFMVSQTKIINVHSYRISRIGHCKLSYMTAASSFGEI